MRKSLACLLAVFLLAGLVSAAFAGENHLVVATDGKGIPVYTSATGKRQAGLLYNGFETYDIALKGTDNRYAVRLTGDTTVWVNQRQAQKRLPEGFDDRESPGAETIPCGCYLAEVVRDGAKLWSGTGHRHALAEHRAGTLVMVCGSFGKDAYVEGAGWGFMAGSALRKVRDLTFPQTYDGLWGLEDAETAEVFLEQGELALGVSATGISEISAYASVRNGDRVAILRDLGDQAQVAVPDGRGGWGRGGFIAKRYLDPAGDHSLPTAVIRTDHPLNRLNVRYAADKDSESMIRLCSGLRVQVVGSANGWTEIAVRAEQGTWQKHGFVKSEYLVTGPEADAVPDGSVRVRLLRDYRPSRWSDLVYPAGTEGTVIGVEEPNSFVIRLDSGEVRSFSELGTGPLLAPVEPRAWAARTAKKAVLREGPGSDARKLRTLKSGAAVEVLLRGEKWALVRVDGETGYVLSNVLKPVALK